MIELASLLTDWTWVYLLLLAFGGLMLVYKLKITFFPDYKATIVSFPDYGPEACTSCKSTNKGRMSIPMTVKREKDGEIMEVEASTCELCLNDMSVGSRVSVSKVGSRSLMQSSFGLKGGFGKRIKKNPRRMIGLLFIIGLLTTVLLIAAFTDAQSIEADELTFSAVGSVNEAQNDTALRVSNEYVEINVLINNPYNTTNVTVSLYNQRFHDSVLDHQGQGVNVFDEQLGPFQNSTVFDTDLVVLINTTTIQAVSGNLTTASFNWTLDTDDIGAHYLYVILTPEAQSDPNATINSTNSYLGVLVYGDFEEDTAIYLTLKFWIGFVALVMFFAMVLLSLLGVIPQDRLPVQAALILTAFVIVILAFIGSLIDDNVLIVSAQDLEGMVIIHPITALAAGFLVAGALEAAGAFEAAADFLNKMEVLKIGKWEVLGIAGTVGILVNVPTIVSMPCGRILAAALMPAALYFGYKIARMTGDLRIVGVVVFGFIVNAAASCGPSPLGGIGTIGEGLARMPIGTFSDAQQMGIMLCTGVCMVILRFVTPLIPADLKEEMENKVESAEAKVGSALGGSKAKDAGGEK